MNKIKRLAILQPRGLASRRICQIRVGSTDLSFPFDDLVGLSDGLQDVLAETERLVPTNAIRPVDKTFMHIESIHVSDAVEQNRNLYSGREVRERRDEGQHICGGDWYMELGVNGADNDLSFSSVRELFDLVQQVMKRELRASGAVVSQVPVTLVRAA